MLILDCRFHLVNTRSRVGMNKCSIIIDSRYHEQNKTMLREATDVRSMRSSCLFYQESPWVISLKAVIVPDCGRLMRVLAELHHTGRVKKLAFGRGMQLLRVSSFLLQKYGLWSQSRARHDAYTRVYTRSQLSRPSRSSFSSRSNNNNHSLFAYITPPPPASPWRAVRIKFPLHTAPALRGVNGALDAKSPEFAKSMAT